MKTLKIKPFPFLRGGTAKRKEGSAQVSCSPRSPEGGLRRSEKTGLIDHIGGGIL